MCFLFSSIHFIQYQKSKNSVESSNCCTLADEEAKKGLRLQAEHDIDSSDQCVYLIFFIHTEACLMLLSCQFQLVMHSVN